MTVARRDLRAQRANAGATSTIGRRVGRILALPAVVVLLLLGVVATQEVDGYRNSQDTARSVEFTLGVQTLVHQLQNERGATSAVLGGNPSFRNELNASRLDVDRQRAAVARLAGGDGAAREQMRKALAELDGLPAVRAATDSAAAGRAAMFDYFTQRISALTTVDLGLDRAADDELRRGASALEAVQAISEAAAQERAFLNGVFSAGGFAPGEFVRFAGMRTAKDAAFAAFRRAANPTEKASADYLLETGAARETAYFEQVALGAADGHRIVVNPQSWWSGLTTMLDDLSQLQRHVGSEIRIRAHDLQNEAAQRIAVLILAVLLCFGGSIVLAVLASLSITRPLAALASEADAVASQRLPAAVEEIQASPEGHQPKPPEAVKVPSRATKEVRSVASALDRLQSAAYDLATEQTTQRQRTIASLANLGRRNQNLIRRQLGFITSLEREEMDPGSLANLFELDHLATRMRRNAASLLVLVGESGPRQWSTPVAIPDVIRAAVSEVEEYRRVALRRVDDALVAGPVVGSVAHLLAELIENALTFSPPDVEVEIQGRGLPDGYLIAIIDQGIGMRTADLTEANLRVRGEGDFISAPTRYLGHFVVGQIARETGVHVELVRSPVVGITARITLPASALIQRAPIPAARKGSQPVGGPPSRPIAVLDAGTDTGALAIRAEASREPRPVPEKPSPPEVIDLTALERPDNAGLQVVEALPDDAGAAQAGSGADEPAAINPAPWSPWEGRPGEAAWDNWSAEQGAPTQQPDAGAPAATRLESVPVGSTRASWSASTPGQSGTSGMSGTSGASRSGSGPNAGRSFGGVPTDEWGTEEASGERTRNGLRKRVPRTSGGQGRASSGGGSGHDGPARPSARGSADAGRAEVVGDSPAELRSRLLSLRAGMERGQGVPVGSGAAPGRPGNTEPAAEDTE